MSRMIVSRLLERAARRYVAGPELSDAVACAQAIGAHGMPSTIAYWNDVGEDPARVHEQYAAAVAGAAGAELRTYLSVKAPALSMSPERAHSLADLCRRHDIGLHFDSMRCHEQEPTFALIERLLGNGTKAGCTLPARFARSCGDAELAIERGLRVRVVKGQWDDPERSIDVGPAFLGLIRQLAGRAAHVAVATHDPRLAEEALTELLAEGTPTELELLWGLPMHAAREIASRLNVTVRVYIPYGRAWLPYSLSALGKNPRMLWWMLIDAARGGTLPGRRGP